MQQCLIALIEKWNSATDKGKPFRALLTDISKVFHCLPHELLIAKLQVYGLSLASSRLDHSYLSNRKQSKKMKESYGSWEAILFRVPQGSISGTLLFNMFICDFFIIIDDINIANSADYNNLFVSGDTWFHLHQFLLR